MNSKVTSAESIKSELTKLRLTSYMAKSYVDRNSYPEPTPDEIEKQLEKKLKYVRKITDHLKPFSPHN